MKTKTRNTRLDRSHELSYLKKYQGKKFKVQAEIDIPNHKPNVYYLGALSTLDQVITIDWWKTVGKRKEQHAVEYRLGDVLKHILLNDWIILTK